MAVSRGNRYTGMAYPFGPTLKEYFSAKNDRDILRTSIVNCIFTMFGERVMLGEFGSDIQNIPFAMNDEVTANDVRDIVQGTIERWDPRIEVIDLSISQNAQDGKQLDCVVIYRDKNDPIIQDNFSFPLGEAYTPITTFLG